MGSEGGFTITSGLGQTKDISGVEVCVQFSGLNQKITMDVVEILSHKVFLCPDLSFHRQPVSDRTIV